MRDYDQENRADDDRNNKMSDMAADIDRLSYENQKLKKAINEITQLCVITLAQLQK